MPISQFFIVKYLKNRFFFVYFKKILKFIKSYRCNKPNFQHDNPLRHDSIHLRFCRKNWSLFHHSSRKMKRRNTPLHLYLLQSLGCRSTSKSRHFHRNQLRQSHVKLRDRFEGGAVDSVVVASFSDRKKPWSTYFFIGTVSRSVSIDIDAKREKNEIRYHHDLRCHDITTEREPDACHATWPRSQGRASFRPLE